MASASTFMKVDDNFVWSTVQDHSDTTEDPFVALILRVRDLEVTWFMRTDEHLRKMAERLRSAADDLEELQLPTRKERSD